MTPSLIEANLPEPAHATLPSCIDVWSVPQYLLLRGIARQYPLLTHRQTKRFLQHLDLSARTAQCEVDALISDRYLERRSCMIRLPVVPETPSFCWHVGNPPPTRNELRTLTARGRFEGKSTPIWFHIATRETANLFGGSYRGQLPLTQLPLCIALSEVALRLKKAFPRLGDALDADGLPSFGQARRRLPPHLRIRHSGNVLGMIAVPSFASVSLLEALHAHCERRSTPYFLW